MAKDPPPPRVEGEELYIELWNGSTWPTTQFMDIIKKLQHELDHLKSNNECMLKYSEE